MEEIDEKERTVLDLGYKETNYHSRQMEVEDDTLRATWRKCFREYHIDPDFPSLESSFEVDERGKNGREKGKER